MECESCRELKRKMAGLLDKLEDTWATLKQASHARAELGRQLSEVKRERDELAKSLAASLALMDALSQQPRS